VFLAYAALHNLDVRYADFVAAFLNGSLQEELYLTPVPGYPSQGGTCLRLHKAIYGLKQAAAQWYGAVSNCLLRLGFVALEADPCFFRRLQDGQITLVILYVDDVAVAGSATDTQDTIKQLGMAYAIEDRGTIDGGSLLGMQVSRNWEERTILINQRPYIEQLVERFGLINSAPLRAATPMEKGLQLSTHKGQPTSAPYLELFGALNYLSVISRPDITFAVGALGRFNSCPSEQHWHCLKHVLRYVQGTKALSLVLGSRSEPSLAAFCDSDFAGDVETRRSTSGYLIYAFGALVNWSSKRQRSIVTSSHESEYIGLSQACKNVKWVAMLLQQLLGQKEEPTATIYGDNQGAMTTVKNGTFTAHSKHIDIRYKHARELWLEGKIKLEYCPTEQMLADILTKSLDSRHFSIIRGQMGLKDVTSGSEEEC
jgi:Reverse transcriptase (RNA-dependent DNA polymerase)